MPPVRSKRSAEAHKVAPKRAKTSQGTASQPIPIEATPPEIPIRTSPRKALAIAASQATDERPFERQLLYLLPENAIAAPTKSSNAATNAPTEVLEVVNSGDEGSDGGPDSHLADDFAGIVWDRLPGYCKPLRTPRHKKSWIYKYGYRVSKSEAPQRTFWVCKYCHQRRVSHQSFIHETTSSTTAALRHLAQVKLGHNITKAGAVALKALPGGQRSLQWAAHKGVVVSQEVANTVGNFDVAGFRYAAVSWLIDNNHPLREFETQSFRDMIAYANPEAAEALWTSHNSVSRYVIRLYSYLQPKVILLLSNASSKIHVSFDGWTTKGGKRGFMGIVAHFADSAGTIRDLPIALPQLTGAHTGEKIAEVVTMVLQEFGISSTQLGYFILDNASANDTAVANLARLHSFVKAHRRLRCAPHTLNLIGQAIMFGVDEEAYNNSEDEWKVEAQYLKEWRCEGPLGVLIAIVNYINTPKQHALFEDAQRLVNALPHAATTAILEPVKPVVTRWNSYHDTFERAVLLKDAVDKYASDHIERQARDDAYAASRRNKLLDAPAWMRSGGLTAADWAVITEYIAVLKPLKEATRSLEARGTSGSFGAIYEVYPVYEAVLKAYETALEPYGGVNHNELHAPEDHLVINLRAAWHKLDRYYLLLDDSPAYYAACCLHPYYKSYCEKSWRDKPSWIRAGEAGLQQLWAQYRRPLAPLARTLAPRTSSIRDAIAAMVNTDQTAEVAEVDQLERWRRFELPWDDAQFDSGLNPIKYWQDLRPKYPQLAQLAIDVLTIPASSCDCERMFSELGDLLEPRRRKISSNLLAALQCIKSWRAAGFKP
ncbi:Dimer-Tnp-hAT dimerization containing protein [Pyrenophora tritici-repentis]|uniref:Dimer-Tnp-hAT dimerization containing protein n=2 Tax=Pyrenophora tritici-repentis TaxID=45151 RepID=A0A316ZVC2_9PLEO|nr:Dimer-Tnp-hAT dimerization containing protein [Pyrenophora tritici-repentis]